MSAPDEESAEITPELEGQLRAFGLWLLRNAPSYADKEGLAELRTIVLFAERQKTESTNG